MFKRSGAMGGIGGAIDSALKEHELDQAMRIHRAVAIWPEVAGEYNAKTTIAEKVIGTVLYVCTENSQRSNELSMLKGMLLSKLNAQLGGRVITDVHFRVTGWKKLYRERHQRLKAAPKGPTDSDLSKVAMNERQSPKLPDTLDDRLRETLTRAARAREWKRLQGWQPCARCGALYPPPDERGGLCPLCALL